jgi:cobalt-zinc-cadmium efflux system outer membrane protein
MPGSTISRMGPIPGTGAMVLGNAPGTDQMILAGGRPGVGYPRVQGTSNMNQGMAVRMGRGIVAPTRVPASALPVYGSLALPTTAEDEGPPDGLTLDQAIERLVADNLSLRSKFYELPQAQTDILTASLRENPLFYADTQLIPYGHYNRDRPGGPTQTDINIAHPFDLSGKWIHRTRVAQAAESVMQAQYQEAVRVQIDNLYTAFLDVLAARETVRLARASIEGLDRLLKVTEILYEKADATRSDIGRVRVQRSRAELGLVDALEALNRSRLALGALLNIPPDQARLLDVRASIKPPEMAVPDRDTLLRIALESRPDLAAQRLAVGRALTDVDFARAARFADVYLLYQPYTFQNNAPFGLKSPTSWALGATVPIPLFNRNQGHIARSRLNVYQTEIELTGLEQRVIAEVVQAEREVAITRQILREIERALLPDSKRMRDDAFELFTAGEIESVGFFDRQRQYNDDVRYYRDTLVRHRRSALRLNTAVGQRILP